MLFSTLNLKPLLSVVYAEFSTARYLDRIRSPCNCEQMLLGRHDSRSDSADRKVVRKHSAVRITTEQVQRTAVFGRSRYKTRIPNPVLPFNPLRFDASMTSPQKALNNNALGNRTLYASDPQCKCVQTLLDFVWRRKSNQNVSRSVPSVWESGD